MGFHLLTGHSEVESHRLDVLLFFSSRLLPPFFSSSLRNQFFHFGAMALGRHLEISPGFADSFQIPSKKIFFSSSLMCLFSECPSFCKSSRSWKLQAQVPEGQCVSQHGVLVPASI